MKKKEPVKYDLGCGNNKQEGYIGVDASKDCQADVVFDLNQPKWTFAKDESASDLFCSHFVEHVDSLMNFFNEAHRILIPGGQLVVIAPYYSSIRCWQDPTHKNAISEASFFYYNKEWRNINGLSHYPITADFDFNYGYRFSPEWASRSDEARAFAVKHYINVIEDIYVTLTKR